MMIYLSLLSGFYWNTANIRANKYNRQKAEAFRCVDKLQVQKNKKPFRKHCIAGEGRRKEEREKNCAVILLLNKVL